MAGATYIECKHAIRQKNLYRKKKQKHFPVNVVNNQERCEFLKKSPIKQSVGIPTLSHDIVF